MILPEYNLLYFHIPRTGGTSVSYFFKGRKTFGIHTSCLKERSEVLDGEHAQYLKFCTVRNPVERLVSIHNIYMQGGNGTKEDAVVRDYVRETGFDKFIEMATCDAGVEELMGRFRQFELMLRPQVEWVYEKGNDVIDFAVAIEDLDDFFDLCRNKFGIKRGKQCQNITVKNHNLCINEEAEDRICDYYSQDCFLHFRHFQEKRWKDLL